MEGPANSGDPTLMRPPQREFEFLRVRGCITLAACRYVVMFRPKVFTCFEWFSRCLRLSASAAATAAASVATAATAATANGESGDGVSGNGDGGNGSDDFGDGDRTQ